MRKFIFVLFALVLALSLSLVPAVPAMAGDPSITLTDAGTTGITSVPGTLTTSGTEAGTHSIVVTNATASTLTGNVVESATVVDTIANTLAGDETLIVTIAGEPITTGTLTAATADSATLAAVAADIQTKINAQLVETAVTVSVTNPGGTGNGYFVITVDEAGVSNSITTQVTGTNGGETETGLGGVDAVDGTDAKAVDTFAAATGSNGLWVAANPGSTKTITHTTAAGTASTLAGLEALVEAPNAFINGITITAATALAVGTAVITVAEGTAGRLKVTGASATMTAGGTNELTVTAYDDADNLATAYTGPKNLTFTGPSIAPDGTSAPNVEGTAMGVAGAVNFTNGVSDTGVATLTAYCAETTTVHVSDAVIDSTGYGLGLTVNPGALASFTITGTPAGVLAGTAFPSPITVTAYDTWGNIKTDYTGTVTWSSSASASLPANYTFDGGDAGAHIFPGSEFTLFSAGTHIITVTDGLVSAPSSGIAVTVVIGGWAPPAPTIEANLFGSVLSFSISDTGEILETVTGTSADGNLTLTIPAGTIALDEDGNPLSTLTSDVDVSPPPPPSHIIGLAYNFGPNGATFNPAITLTWSYDPDALPEGVAEEDLVIAYYDEEAGEWVECDFTCDPETDCVTGYVCHFTTFAIIAHTPAPAAFSASNLSIQPSEVQPKEAVTITLSVANTGGTEGSYAVVLKINDVKETEKSVTVAAGSSQSVSFSVTREKAGSYSVAVNGLSGSFTVKEPVPTPAPPPAPPPTPPPAPEAINWWLIGGIIAAVVVGLLIFFLVVRRRA